MWLVALGTSVATLLSIVLLSAYQTPRAVISGYVGHSEVDLWVAPAGGDNLFRSTSFFPNEIVQSLPDVDGVASADPLVRSYVSVSRAGSPDHRLTVLAIGYRLRGGGGGPPAIAEGREPGSADEVALDRAAAFRLRVRPGDSVDVSGRRAKLSGLTTGTNLFAAQMLFLESGRAKEIAGLGPVCSFGVVRLVRGADPAAVASRIESRWPRIRAFTKEEFVANNLREASEGFRPILATLLLLGGIASVAFVALLVQGHVADLRADIAVLLAMGVPARSACLALFANVAIHSASGALAGVAASRLLDRAIEALAPTVQLSVAPSDALLVAALLAVAGVAGAVGPLVALLRIDPLEAFRA